MRLTEPVFPKSVRILSTHSILLLKKTLGENCGQGLSYSSLELGCGVFLAFSCGHGAERGSFFAIFASGCPSSSQAETGNSGAASYSHATTLHPHAHSAVAFFSRGKGFIEILDAIIFNVVVQVRELALATATSRELRWTGSAMIALQEAAEAYIVQLMEDS